MGVLHKPYVSRLGLRYLILLFALSHWGQLMRRMSIAVIAAASSVALMQIASAADLPRKAPAYTPPAPAVYSWTGFYIGANIGGGWGDRNVTYTSNDPAAPIFFHFFGPLPPTSFRIDGVIGGAQLGYNWQFHPIGSSDWRPTSTGRA
jgi:opacity protein-like surface antigen